MRIFKSLKIVGRSCYGTLDILFISDFRVIMMCSIDVEVRKYRLVNPRNTTLSCYRK